MKGYKGPNSVQRRNNAMFAMFEKAKSEGRGLNGNSHMKGYGVNSPAMTKARALSKMKAK
jgi:hypothetical protein